ncbi:Brp/Blh family beta-carotene 15,15'-dioxygenase [Lacinutrix jangbogonensis]|uniref:Brp/Blh family beta-carotene 15,15'-dioxygenase n=1 Tax=Lacinutrix jangbogonensis TaxID=1469557 RepID=UPI00053D7AA0|nr:Brp/Blh family beta-carotene 15,15'-dioxygenase [Lacinutrix jangbogonensis]
MSSKIKILPIVLSFFGLWIATKFSSEFEVVLGFILILSFGILHGSNDILLIDSLSNSKAAYPFVKILSIYLLTVLTAVVVFYFIPILALVLFIIFSAFHFGEQHWENRALQASKWINNLFYLVYGLLILFLLFIINKTEVIEVVKSITEYNINERLITYSTITVGSAFILLSLYLIFKSETYKKDILKEFFYILVFFIIFKSSTLIWGFTIYFIFWHSIPSLFEQITFIYGDFSKKNILLYFKKASPYWVISLIGIAGVYYIFKDQKLFYAVFFSFIAAVTFPHSIVINKMFAHKKTQPN